MKKLLQSQTLSTGLAIFSMFFGAGNLIFPLKVGLISGTANLYGIAGFLLTGVLLPLIGLIAIILYDGNYKNFFNTLGRIPGGIMAALCLFIIGPLIAMPRIVTLSHIMVSPFLNDINLATFTIIFLVAIFLGTYKESKLIDLLGHFVSPALLISLAIIIIKGFYLPAGALTAAPHNMLEVFSKGLKIGYNTLDLLGAIFFSAIVITILKRSVSHEGSGKKKHLALLTLKAGSIGVSLLALIYAGMSYLGVLHGTGLHNLNEGELFSVISFRIMGPQQAIIIAIAVLMACYSTIVALAAVFAEYLKKSIFFNTISYPVALALTLIITGILSNFGLSGILEFSAPIIITGYPALIALTLANVCHKWFGLPTLLIKGIVFGTLLLSIGAYVH
jgi:LIVCS family branched-chain amino acid:cation transporter